MTDGLPALALSAEPAEKDLMKRPPRNPRESIFAQGLGIHAIWVGLLMAGVVLGLQAGAIHQGDTHWQTMVFTTLCLLQLGHVLAIRSERLSLFKQGLLSNKLLLGSVLVTLTASDGHHLYPGPELRVQNRTADRRGTDGTLLLASVVFLAVEIEKSIKRRKRTPERPNVQ